MHTVCSHSDAPLQVVRFFLLRRRKTEKEIGAQKRMRDTDTYTHTPHRELHTMTSKESELKFEKEF